MALRFQAQPENLPDDGLSMGFSFQARQANKEGQFSGPILKSIFPGVHAASPSMPALPAEPLLPRIGFEFSCLPFPNNLQNESTEVSARLSGIPDQVLDPADENITIPPRLSQHDSEGEPQIEIELNSPLHPIQTSQQFPSFDTDMHTPSSQSCERQNLGSSRVERQRYRSSCEENNGASASINAQRGHSSGRNGRRSRSKHRKSHSPTQHCGDLEGYGSYAASEASRTPPSHPRPTHRSHLRTGNFALDSPVPRRPNSRASNISRKRSFASADRHTSEPDRKRFAMDQAVKHWNECIQLATEESTQAKSTISTLKKRIQQHEEELQTAQEALQVGGVSFSSLQIKYKDLKLKDTQVLEDKKNLEVRLEGLQAKYESLQNQIGDISQKYSGCKDKLDGAISEQRDLFNKSRDFYLSLESQMKLDEAQRQRDAAIVGSALQASQQKREELENVVDQMEFNNERQKSEYDVMVLSLEKDVEHHRSKFESELKRNDLLEDQTKLNRLTESLVNYIDSRLGAVSRNLRRLDGGQDAAVLELNDINTKIGHLPGMDDVAELKNQLQVSSTKLNSLEALVQSRLLPSIASLASNQINLHAMVEPLANSLESGLAKLQCRIHAGAADLSQKLTRIDETQSQIVKSLSQVWAGQADVSSRMESVNNRLENIAGSISTDGIVGANMTSILEMTHKSSEVGERLLAAQEHTQKLAQRNEEVLASQINAKFSDHDSVLRELLAELKGVFMTNLTKLQADLATNTQSTKLDESANRLSVETWKLQDVERIRSDLKRVESKLSMVDSVPSSLQKIYELSMLIQETSKYMEKEEDWIQQKLGEQASDLSSSNAMDKSTSESPTSHSSEYSSVYFSSSSQGSTGSDVSESQVRKVTVQSPSPQVDSPLRVSTAQEQRRRRESAKPKSILKGSQERCSQDRATTARLVGKPAAGDINASENTIDDIRSTLVQSPPLRKSHGFTSMAEYIKSSKAVSRPDQTQIGELTDLADMGREVGNVVAMTITAAVV